MPFELIRMQSKIREAQIGMSRRIIQNIRFVRYAQDGFTLTELMLAMVLFSTVLVISSVGFIGMNRTFNRGTIKKQLSSGVQAVSDDITRTMRSQPTHSLPQACYSTNADYPNCKNTIADNWSWLSFSNTCYLWQYSSEGSLGGVYKSTGSCGSDSLNDKKAILGERYIVRAGISVSAIGTDNDAGTQLYAVSGVFSTREDDAIHVPVDANDRWRCKGTAESSNVATCAVQQFNFIVNPRGNSL